MTTVKAYLYRMGRYQDIDLESEDKLSFDEELERWGYNKYPTLEFGNEYYCGVKVYKSSSATIADITAYFVEFTMVEHAEYILVEAFPSLLELLEKLVPITDATLRKLRYDDDEALKREQENAKGKK
ncbi:MAG: hypothetical protein IPK17_38545 [Chloroflexi bacterium]|uniref:hypothetical protein n=1 Tax=Candidatus Flexifilum breve TaxID=3140694 RepID=UPI0031351498|nr:hypothetical protein [Chloroflexota bacterium]